MAVYYNKLIERSFTAYSTRHRTAVNKSDRRQIKLCLKHKTFFFNFQKYCKRIFKHYSKKTFSHFLIEFMVMKQFKVQNRSLFKNNTTLMLTPLSHRTAGKKSDRRQIKRCLKQKTFFLNCQICCKRICKQYPKNTFNHF